MESDCGKQVKRSTPEDNRATSRMESLPHEIILDILSRLPISSLIQFKFVCKAWRSLVQDPHLANMYLSSTAENDPCLILHSDAPIRNWLYFTNFSATKDEKERVKKFHLPFWAAMPEFHVVGSCNGLLCLCDSLYKDPICIYNPFTRDFKELPKSLQYPNQELVFGFGVHPKTKEYKVVKIIYYTYPHRGFPRSGINNQKSEVQIFTLGTPTWRSIGKVSYLLDEYWPSDALVNGRLHWITRPRRRRPARSVISFDLADEKFREVPTPDFSDFKNNMYHLMVLEGCLAAVHTYYGKMEIWVMKNYDMKESWIKEFNIGYYLPRGLKQDVNPTSKIRKNSCRGRFVRVLCMFKNGELLFEYNRNALATHDPKSGTFKDLSLQGMPDWFQTTVHVGSLNWFDTAAIDN